MKRLLVRCANCEAEAHLTVRSTDDYNSQVAAIKCCDNPAVDRVPEVGGIAFVGSGFYCNDSRRKF